MTRTYSAAFFLLGLSLVLTVVVLSYRPAVPWRFYPLGLWILLALWLITHDTREADKRGPALDNGKPEPRNWEVPPVEERPTLPKGFRPPQALESAEDQVRSAQAAGRS